MAPKVVTRPKTIVLIIDAASMLASPEKSVDSKGLAGLGDMLPLHGGYFSFFSKKIKDRNGNFG